MSDDGRVDLADFLLTRIAEDEAAARSRDLSRPIHYVGCYYYDNTLDANLYCDCDEDGAAAARVLAECEAKRRAVSYADTMIKLDRDPHGTRTFDAGHILRAIALTYADHPDYDESWRP